MVLRYEVFRPLVHFHYSPYSFYSFTISVTLTIICFFFDNSSLISEELCDATLFLVIITVMVLIASNYVKTCDILREFNTFSKPLQLAILANHSHPKQCRSFSKVTRPWRSHNLLTASQNQAGLPEVVRRPADKSKKLMGRKNRGSFSLESSTGSRANFPPGIISKSPSMGMHIKQRMSAKITPEKRRYL